MEHDKLLGALGLARRAGALAVGTDSVLEAVAAGRAVLVLCAQDLSAASRRRLQNAVGDACVPVDIPLSMDQLAPLLHKAAGVLAVTDKNLAVLCRKNLPSSGM